MSEVSMKKGMILFGIVALVWYSFSTTKLSYVCDVERHAYVFKNNGTEIKTGISSTESVLIEKFNISNKWNARFGSYDFWGGPSEKSVIFNDDKIWLYDDFNKFTLAFNRHTQIVEISRELPSGIYIAKGKCNKSTPI